MFVAQLWRFSYQRTIAHIVASVSGYTGAKHNQPYTEPLYVTQLTHEKLMTTREHAQAWFYVLFLSYASLFFCVVFLVLFMDSDLSGVVLIFIVIWLRLIIPKVVSLITYR